MRNFRNYGLYDVSNLKIILENEFLDWEEFDFRQAKFDVHRETKTIPILFDKSFEIKKPKQKTTKYLLKKYKR